MKRYDLDIVMVVAGLEMTGDMLERGQSLGGSETAGIQMARELAKLGNHVTVFCNTQKPHSDRNVLYQPIGWIQHAQGGFPKHFFDYCRSTPVDVVIVQRVPAFFSFGLESKVNFLWQHDLATKTGPSNFHAQLWNIDKIFVLSEFHKKQYQQVHGGPDQIYHVTRNGIDLDLIDSVPEQKRDRFRLTYTARPERGLDILLQRVFPRILQQEPRARLYLSRYQDAAILPLYQQLEPVIRNYGDKIVFMGNLGKAALYEHYKRSRLFLYPSAFEEISHISQIEFGACGGVMIGPWRGACPETANGSHVWFTDDGSPGRPEYPLDPGFVNVSDRFCEAIADKAVELMHDDEQWQRLSTQARQRAEQWTWKPVAEDWTNLALEQIEKRSGDSMRLFKHFVIHSDIVAAKKLAERENDERLKRSLDNYVNSYVPFMNVPESERREAINQFYEQRSGGDRANWMTGFFAEQEPRLKALLMWMEPLVKAGEIKTVLDFGCAHGGYARVISNTFPEVKVVGVDNSPSLIRCCDEMRAGQLNDGAPVCKYPQNLDFVVGDEDTDLSNLPMLDMIGHPNLVPTIPLNGGFDLLVAMEVLEHLPHAEEVAQKLERHCRKDGYMLFTVPVGRRERDEYVTKGVPPVHVRSFDLHDLRDLFNHRRECSIVSFSDLKDLEWDKSFAGWFMVSYRKDEGQIGAIDWERKLALQGPRETLAVCMIANNCDTTLRRTLKSIEKIADQIVLVDNGPSLDRTVETALEFNAIVRAGTSPHYCYTHAVIHPWDQITPGVCEMAGFDTPRNESIEDIWCDWVLWIDSDEEFVDSPNTFKYLRPNLHYGYAVQQHHLSVDAGKMKVDLPVRLFRNHLGIKFYGCVHEHAELGPNRGMGQECIAMPDLNLKHDGYSNEDVRRGRFRRNLKLLECDRIKNPDRILGRFLYDVRDEIHQARYSIEQSHGQLTPEARKSCEHVIDTYRNHFLGSSHLVTLAQDGLPYYSEALAILGLGLEFCIAVDAKKQGAQQAGYDRFRAMNKEEAMRIIGMKLHFLTQNLDGPYVA